VDGGRGVGVGRLVRDEVVSEALGQSFGQIGQASEEPFALGSQQAAAFDQLQDQMRDLQQQVVVFELSVPKAVRVLQVEPAVLLDVKSFVFDFPSASSSAQGLSVLTC